MFQSLLEIIRSPFFLLDLQMFLRGAEGTNCLDYKSRIDCLTLVFHEDFGWPPLGENPDSTYCEGGFVTISSEHEAGGSNQKVGRILIASGRLWSVLIACSMQVESLSPSQLTIIGKPFLAECLGCCSGNPSDTRISCPYCNASGEARLRKLKVVRPRARIFKCAPAFLGKIK